MDVPAIRNHFGIQSEEDIDGITAEQTFEILHDFDIKGMQEHEDYDGPEKYHFRKDGTEDTDHRKSIIAKALKIKWWPNPRKLPLPLPPPRPRRRLQPLAMPTRLLLVLTRSVRGTN